MTTGNDRPAHPCARSCECWPVKLDSPQCSRFLLAWGPCTHIECAHPGAGQGGYSLRPSFGRGRTKPADRWRSTRVRRASRLAAAPMHPQRRKDPVRSGRKTPSRLDIHLGAELDDSIDRQVMACGRRGGVAAHASRSRPRVTTAPRTCRSRRWSSSRQASNYRLTAGRFVRPTSAGGRQCPFAVVSSGRSTGLRCRQASSGRFRDFDFANGRQPASAVPCKPVVGEAIFWQLG